MKPYKEIAPTIFVVDDFLPNSEEYVRSAVECDQSLWIDASIGKESEIDPDIRNTKLITLTSLAEINPLWVELNNQIWQYGDSYASHHEVWFSGMEVPQLLRYDADEGFYKAHVDSGKGAERIFSAVLYLNDVEDGGETYFNKFDISVHPKAGRLVFFPANYTFIHEARPPRSGEKFVVVTWFNP